MRLLCFAAALSLLPLMAAQADTLMLDWSDPAPEGSEVIVTLSGDQVQILRSPVAAGVSRAEITLPPLTRSLRHVQAGLAVDGRVQALSLRQPAARLLEPNPRLALRTAHAAGFRDLWVCDDGLPMGITWAEDTPTVTLDSQSTTLAPQEAEGVFASPSGLTVTINGNSLTREMAGQSTDCAPALFAPVIPLRAHGAGWQINLAPDGAEFRLPEGFAPEAAQGLRIFALRDGEITARNPDFVLTLHDTPCRLARGRLAYPHGATLAQTNAPDRLEGCAGDPLALWGDGVWRVTDLLGRPLPPGLREITLERDGETILGRTPCNRYLGRITATDDRLQISDLGTTRLACPANLRNLEARFLDALEAATGFTLTRDGAMILRAPTLGVLRAERRR